MVRTSTRLRLCGCCRLLAWHGPADSALLQAHLWGELIIWGVRVSRQIGSLDAADFPSICQRESEEVPTEKRARHGRITYGQLMDFVKTIVLLYTFAAWHRSRPEQSGHTEATKSLFWEGHRHHQAAYQAWWCRAQPCRSRFFTECDDNTLTLTSHLRPPKVKVLSDTPRPKNREGPGSLRGSWV